MKKILVPVDFSEHTSITCTYAIELAKVFDAEILLFHTYFDQIILTEATFPDSMNMNAIYNEELMREMLKQSEQQMDELKDKLLNYLSEQGISNIHVKTTVVGGDVEMELRMICAEYFPDMVVMGTTGKGKNVHVWGRVSTFIINHAKVPVLTVPELRDFLGFKEVMFAADLSENNAAAIRKVFTLLNHFEVNLTIVHFITGSKRDDIPEKMDQLRRHFLPEEESGKIHFHMVDADMDNQKAVDDFVDSMGINVIAFYPHKRSIFYNLFTRNITKKNLFATNIPLLAIPIEK